MSYKKESQGIDDVLAEGQSLTGSREIDANGNNFTINGNGGDVTIKTVAAGINITGQNSISIGDNTVESDGSVISINPANSTAYYDNTAHNGSFIINGTAPDGSEALKVVGDAKISGHLIGASGTPTIVAGAGLGTSPTVAIEGTDIAGKITFTPDVDNTAGNQVVITFSTAYASIPYVVFSAGNEAAAIGVNISTPNISAITTSGFTLHSGSRIDNQCIFYYHVIQ